MRLGLMSNVVDVKSVSASLLVVATLLDLTKLEIAQEDV